MKSVAFLFVSLMVSGANAAIYVQSKIEMANQMPGTPSITLGHSYIENENYRSDVYDGEILATSIIINKIKTLTVDHKTKSYFEMTKAETDAYKKQMEQVTRGMLGPQKVTVKKTGRKKTVGKWNCEVYLVETTMTVKIPAMAQHLKGMDRREEHCMADHSQIPLLGSVKWYENFFFSSPEAVGITGELLELYKKGTAVEVVSFQGAEWRSKVIITEVSTKNVPANFYAAPAGYQKKSRPALPTGGPPARRTRERR